MVARTPPAAPAALALAEVCAKLWHIPGLAMIFSLIFACTTTAVVGGGVEDGADDTSVDSGGDTGEVIEEPQPETVWEDYEGSRTYSASSDWGACEESTEDEGEELLEGEEFDQIIALCPDCDHVFENDPVESSLCYGAITLGRSWRSVDLNEEGTAGTLAFYIEGDAGLEAWASSEVEFDGSMMPFAYSFELWGIPVDVSGEMVFEFAVPE